MLLPMVADMGAGMVADMEADKEVAKLADMVAGHGGRLIGPKLFRPEPYLLTCVSSKLCEFIEQKLTSIFAPLANEVTMEHMTSLKIILILPKF